LVKGSLIHYALAQYFRRLQAQQRGEPIDVWMEPKLAIDVCAQREAEQDNAVGHEGKMWLDYVPHIQDCFEYWEATFAETGPKYWKVLGVEEELRCSVSKPWLASGESPIVTPSPGEGNVKPTDGGYLYTQRADLIVMIQGKVYVVDHKSTSRPIPKYDDARALSGQMLGYEMLGNLHAKDKWGGVILHYLQVSDKGEFSFDFKSAARAPAVDDFAETILYAEEVYETAIRTGRWPKAYSEHICWTRYGPCPKYSLCKHGIMGLR
jgi:hypothetical protein